jgi:hypothetical protein
MNRSAILAAMLLTMTPVLASAQTARPTLTLPRATVQVQRNVLVLTPRDHADVMSQLQTIIDARPSLGMSTEEVRLMTELAQWAVAQRNRLRYAELVRGYQRVDTVSERLRAIGEDARLANIDLQNKLQRQQQTLQTMSNISRMMHDTAMAVIRKMGG